MSAKERILAFTEGRKVVSAAAVRAQKYFRLVEAGQQQTIALEDENLGEIEITITKNENDFTVIVRHDSKSKDRFMMGVNKEVSFSHYYAIEGGTPVLRTDFQYTSVWNRKTQRDDRLSPTQSKKLYAWTKEAAEKFVSKNKKLFTQLDHSESAAKVNSLKSRLVEIDKEIKALLAEKKDIERKKLPAAEKEYQTKTGKRMRGRPRRR